MLCRNAVYHLYNTSSNGHIHVTIVQRVRYGCIWKLHSSSANTGNAEQQNTWVINVTTGGILPILLSYYTILRQLERYLSHAYSIG